MEDWEARKIAEEEALLLLFDVYEAIGEVLHKKRYYIKKEELDMNRDLEK